MGSWLVIATLLVGCYSGHAAPGAPCTPSLGNCPTSQTCELVAGDFRCVEKGLLDASVTSIDARLPDGAVPVSDAPAFAPWVLVQTAGTTNTNLTIAATGTGHLIVVSVEPDTSNSIVTAVIDNAGNTYVAVPGARSVNTNADVALELWYAKDSRAGATQITATATQVPVNALVAWEVSGIRTTAPLAVAAKLDNRPGSNMPLGAPITTTVTGELVISAAIVNNTIDGLHAGSLFTTDRTTDGDGYVHLTNATAPPGTYQAQWDQSTSGAYCASSAAFFPGP